MCCTRAGEAASPEALPGGAVWLPARVPGTAAQALRDAGRWGFDDPGALHDRDVWYRVAVPASGRRVLRFEGLATVSQAWLDGCLVLETASMFRAREVEVDLARPAVLHLCFRSLSAALRAAPRARGRWRAPMIPDARLRWLRTTLLGHMPGWCPPVHAVGPYRPVLLLDPDGPPPPSHVVLHARRVGAGGRVRARVAWGDRGEADPGRRPVRLRVAGAEAELRRVAPGRLEGEVVLPDAAPWWPATHGASCLHPASLAWGAEEVALPPVGLRDVALDRGADGRGFGLRVNGVPLFCRGAVWTSADPVGSGDAGASPEAGDGAACLPWLEAAKDAGMNLVRVPGTTLYEGRGFYDACDRLGLMVWQDFAFANLDYPTDPAFLAGVEAEAREFLDRTSAHACLAVLCGGSEIAQQAALLGLPRAAWGDHPLFHDLLPRLCAEARPDVPYVPHTPDGPDMPFRADAAPAHYFGAGAYLRPPEDARLAGVRFAAECLALANVPCAATLDEAPDLAPVHGPRWKARTPRDLGAAWDFDDVRDHYLETLFGQDARRLRGVDPGRYLTLSRAVSAALMAEVFAHWRGARATSGGPCTGGLVLALQDLWPGPGWGVLDSLGRPKAAWHALRGVFAPVQVLLLDEGLNGVRAHVVNDTADPVAGVLELSWYRDGLPAAAPAERPVSVPARGGVALSAAEVIGAWRDLAHAHRFGPPAADAVRARLVVPRGHRPAPPGETAGAGEVGRDEGDARGALVTEHWLFPGRLLPPAPLGLRAGVDRDGAGWRLRVRAERVAQGVHLDDPAWRGETEWFHLAPGQERCVRLVPLREAEHRPPEGRVVALNESSATVYNGRAEGPRAG